MAKKSFESDGKLIAGQDAIAQRAYEIWKSEGRPDGRAMEHWLRAVSELKSQDDGVERETTEPKEQRTARRSSPRLNESRFQPTR